MTTDCDMSTEKTKNSKNMSGIIDPNGNKKNTNLNGDDILNKNISDFSKTNISVSDSINPNETGLNFTDVKKETNLDSCSPKNQKNSNISDVKNETGPLLRDPILIEAVQDVSVPLYISMNLKNIEKYKPLIKPVHDQPFLIFDIDNTLYTSNNGLEDETRDVLVRGLEEILRRTGQHGEVNRDDLLKCVIRLCLMYGLSSRGACKEFNIDLAYFEKDFHKINFARFVERDEALRNELKSIKIRKICFTNAGIFHAKNVLRLLGVEDCFEVVITADTDSSLERKTFPSKEAAFPQNIASLIKEFLERNNSNAQIVAYDKNDEKDFMCKPVPEAYRFIEELFSINPLIEFENDMGEVAGGGNPDSTHDESTSNLTGHFGTSKNVLFFDDAFKNIHSANEQGWKAVHVRNEKHIIELIRDSLSTKQ